MQIESFIPASAIGGIFTYTVTLELTVVKPSSTVTVYTVVTVGLTIGLLIVDENPIGFELHE